MGQSCCTSQPHEEFWGVASSANLQVGVGKAATASDDPVGRHADEVQWEASAKVTLLPLVARTKVPAEEFAGLDSQDPDASLNMQLQILLQAAAKQVEGGLDDFLRKWCTREVLGAFMQASSKETAVNSLATALNWRRKHRAILTGVRWPTWQGDMRVVAREGSGHPVIFMSMAHQPPASNSGSIIEHMASVLEAACNHAKNGAWGFDVVCDCRGFQLSKNLDPRPAIAAMEMLKHAYRGRLRRALLVGAPSAFSGLWRMVKGLLPSRTQEKIQMVSLKEATVEIEKSFGEAAQTVLTLLNKPQDTSSWRFPSELMD